MQTIPKLYGTLGCHLCEQAVTLLETLSIEYIPVEITDDDALIDTLGHLIPVLEINANDQSKRLYWPFKETDITEFIQTQ